MLATVPFSVQRVKVTRPLLLARHVAGCDVELNLSVNPKSAGQPSSILLFGLTHLLSIGAGVRHLWLSFGLAGGIARALPCVPVGSASLSG